MAQNLRLAVGDVQRNRVVGGNAQVGGVVQRRGDAGDHHADDQERDADGQRGIGAQLRQYGFGNLHDVTQQEQVYEGGDADVVAIQEEHHDQLHQVHQHVQRAEADGNHVGQAVGEALVGIHAEQGALEEADADAGEQHARRRQHHAQGQLVFCTIHMSILRSLAFAVRRLLYVGKMNLQRCFGKMLLAFLGIQRL